MFIPTWEVALVCSLLRTVYPLILLTAGSLTSSAYSVLRLLSLSDPVSFGGHSIGMFVNGVVVIESVSVVRSFVLVHDVTIGRDGDVDVSITLIEVSGTVDCL
jgi:hypothetical protein